jgi:methionine-rich copper-binding protein CopC
MSMSPVVAHAELVAIEPADGATVPTLPGKAELTLDSPVKSADVILTTAEGRMVTLVVRITDEQIKAVMPATGPRGNYRLAYRVVAEDGHVVTGLVQFTVVQGEQPERQGSAPKASTEIPVAGLIGGAAVLLFVGIVLVLVKVRR